MLRTLVVATALALVLAPAAQAQGPCAPDGGERALDRTDEVVLFRDGRRYRTCTVADGSRWALPESVAVRPLLAGPYVLMFLGDRNDGDLVLGDAPTREQITIDRGAFGAIAVDSSGRVVAVRRTTRRERVIARDLTGGVTVLSSARGRVSRLRLDDGTVTWRRSGARRRHRLPEPRCARRPRGAEVVLADAAAVVSRRETGAPGELRTTSWWACLRADGRHRLLRTTEADFTASSSLGGFLRAGSVVGFTAFPFGRDVGQDPTAIVFDVALGVTVRTVRGAVAAVDEIGRVASISRPPGATEQLVAVDAVGMEGVLDEAPNGQLTDVALEPGLIRWRRGGVVQSAPLP